MLDLDLIRRDPDAVRQALGKRGEESTLERILELDAERRGKIRERDELRARRNQVSQELGRSGERPPELLQEMRRVGGDVKSLEEQLRKVEDELTALLLELPNTPLEDVPLGPDESANTVVRSWGEPEEFDFEPKAHWDLNEELGIIDFQRGVKLSGSRFYLLQGMGARLQRALITWMLDVHTRENDYTEIYPPALVREEVMRGSGKPAQVPGEPVQGCGRGPLDGAFGGGAVDRLAS